MKNKEDFKISFFETKLKNKIENMDLINSLLVVKNQETDFLKKLKQ